MAGAVIDGAPGSRIGFSFRHALLRDVCYEAPMARRILQIEAMTALRALGPPDRSVLGGVAPNILFSYDATPGPTVHLSGLQLPPGFEKFLDGKGK